MQTFFLAMVLHPDAQHKAQAELDAVLSGIRLPTPDDEDSLPYVGAVVKEVLRWHPVVPLGMYMFHYLVPSSEQQAQGFRIA